MPWIEWGSAVLLLAAVVLIVCRLRGAALWAARTRSLIEGLELARRVPAAPRYHPSELGLLPAPVQRYFRAVLTPGHRIATALDLKQHGLRARR